LASAVHPPSRRPIATSESSRARRFALPDLKDDRTGESIEAFLHGRAAKSLALRGQGWRSGDAVALRAMPGRQEFNAALERESTRAARYERPAAVAILELRPIRPSATVDSWLRAQAAPVGRVLLGGSRATDVVARVAATRFQVLLPETSAAAATEFVDRIVGACQEQLQSIGAPVRVAASVAASSADVPLRDALSEALRLIEAA
jgi:GGDEF domain-containing protein